MNCPKHVEFYSTNIERADPVRKLSANLYDIYHCCVYSEKTPDDGQRNCPKNVEFYSSNKFEKLVHLVGFIIRIYHDARSPECQIRQFYILEVSVGNVWRPHTLQRT